MSTNKLRLGSLPKTETVKLNFTCSAAGRRASTATPIARDAARVRGGLR